MPRFDSRPTWVMSEPSWPGVKHHFPAMSPNILVTITWRQAVIINKKRIHAKPKNCQVKADKVGVGRSCSITTEKGLEGGSVAAHCQDLNEVRRLAHRTELQTNQRDNQSSRISYSQRRDDAIWLRNCVTVFALLARRCIALAAAVAVRDDSIRAIIEVMIDLERCPGILGRKGIAETE